MNSPNAVSLVAPARTPRHLRYEAEFLPAALEIVDTPASPAGRAVAATIMAFLCGAIAWAAFGSIDIIATAQGRIIPVGKSKIVQPFDIGVVRAIHVKEGQFVKQGDIVLELDPTTDQSDEKHVMFALMQDRLDIARLKAALSGRAEDFVPPEGATASLIAASRDQLSAQLAEHRAKADALDRQIAQKSSEMSEAKAVREKIEASLPLLSEQRDIRKAAVAIQFGSRLLYLQTEQQFVELKHDLDVQQHREAEAKEALAGLQNERKGIDAEFAKTALSDLSKAQVLESEHEGEVVKSAHKRELRTLRAPVDGVVQQIAVHSRGGIVTPAQQLMVVVPKGTGLEIEATIANRDVGFVHRGQEVAVKVETFNFTRYGLLHGRVESLSQDVVASQDDAGSTRGTSKDPAEVAVDEAQRQAHQPSYVARISLAESGIDTEQGFASLEPGMAVTTEIKTGQRTILDYVLSPLQRMQNDSFRER